MSFRFTREIFKIIVGQICQNIGWHAVQSTPMDILIDVLHRYLLEICKSVLGYSNQYGRTGPNLDDVALAFKDLGISLQEIEEYANNVEPVLFAHKVPAFPVKRPPKLQHPIPARRELLYRSEQIPEHLPLMHPDLEEEDGLLSPDLESGQKKNPMDASGTGEGESTSPLSSPKHGTKRPPNEWSNDIPVSKKPRHYTEEEGRPMREMTSVFMTPTGFISPAREGRAPDPTLPNTLDSPPSTPEPPPPSESAPPKKEKSKDSKKEKSSKSKKDKESSGKKDAKKIKTSKKENKENTALSSEKSSVPSSSSKKEHSSSHKLSKSDKSSLKSSESSHTKIKIDKIKHKEAKDEHKKNKDHMKSSKNKSKMKHGSSSFSKSLKSPKTSKSPQKSIAKSPKKSSSKSPKGEKKPSHSAVAAAAATALLSLPPAPLLKTPPTPSPPPPPPLPLLPPVVIKQELEEEEEEIMETPYEVKEEKIDFDHNDGAIEFEERIDSREESPEPRLVIDDSLETQARQERESRLASLDECITAVIQRGQEESEMEAQKSHKAVDEVINEVARGPMVRKFEAKDIYDFTDSSDLSSLSSLEPGDDDDDDSSIDVPVIKKEKSKTPESEKSFEIPKKSKSKEKPSKKAKDSKPKSPISLTSPKNRKSPNVIVKREERSPSRIRLKEDIFSSDASSLSPSPSPPPSFSDFPPQKNGPSIKSEFPPASPFIHSSSNPSTSFSSSPFAPIPAMPCHIQANPHFPTPPLFVTSKPDPPSAFPSRVPSPQPLNLAKSSSSLSKGPSDAKVPEMHHSVKSEDLFDAPKIKLESSVEKEKSKVHRKEKKEKVEKKAKLKRKGREPKEKEKSKPPKVKMESAKEKEKEKPKEMPKPKPEKVVKEVKKRGRPEKKKNKAKEQKATDDSVTRLTLKFSGGNSGSGQFPSPSPSREERSPSPPPRNPTPPPPPPPPQLVPPPKVNTQPAPPAPEPSPPPAPIRQPSPLPPTTMIEPSAPLSVTKTHSRGRGRGRKPAAQPVAPPPPARTVITETLGTIVDEEGNKIWICPACTRPDDGSPMIGCDECDDWYHWVCVNIVVPPKEEESWYCGRCIAKRQSTPAKNRRKKHKKGK